ncbi:hypothetical protein MKR01_26875 [Klebsiella sp. K4-154]|uniref:hypothetical protein n=1 Tax=Klebsiella sp. K4-154 TaxID=2920183 RepID=UPI0024DE231A|nr:hypothetical protein [Klebsiella sp. K4-154]MDK1978598.1 hypothetical protein [Klebsiella sp. K4-154]
MAKYRIFPRSRLFRNRSLLSVTAWRRAAARRQLNKRVAKKYDPFAITLGIIAIIGLLSESTALIFTGVVCFVGYMLIKHSTNDSRRVIKSSKSKTPETDDQKALREWDEHVKKVGGYSGEDWKNLMKGRDKRR